MNEGALQGENSANSSWDSCYLGHTPNHHMEGKAEKWCYLEILIIL